MVMNERIRELSLAAGGSHYPSINPEIQQRFAELIVQECVRYFNEDYQRDFDSLWREDLSKGIKKHFGVER
jgi:hypothetical protein